MSMDYQLSDSSSDEEFWDLANSSSDEELLNLQIRALQEEKGRRRRRGSITGRLYKDRERLQGHQRLFKDYFSENPIHGEDIFRRRFRMHRPLFLRIVDDVTDHDSYFVQKRDGASRLGLSSLQKCTTAMRMLAYGVGADVVDDYIRIGESTAIEALRRDGGFWLCIGRRCYLAKVNGGYALIANARWSYVVRLAMRYNGKKRMKAAALCAITAKEIFEGLRKRDDLADNQFAASLDDKDLEYLETASLLHN